MQKKVFLFLMCSLILTACSGLAQVQDEDPVAEQVLQSTISESDSEQGVGETLLLESEEENSTDSEPEEDLFTFPDPNPINLSIQIDDQQAIEAEIGPQGGSLELVTAGGDRFILEIPEGALLSPEMIRISPIISIDGFPFENPGVIAVNLQPEGLIFFKMGTLRILPASLSGEGDTVGFATEGNGADFHLQPSVEDGNEVRLPIVHFSNYGINEANNEVLRHINSIYSPSTATTYAWDQITTIEKLVSDDVARLEAYEKILTQWLYSSILTRIENAAVFEGRLDFAVGEYRQWIDAIIYVDFVVGLNGRMRERLVGEIEIAMDAMANTIFQHFERNYIRCVENNDPQAAIRMYRYGLTVTALNLWDRSGLDRDAMEAKVLGCFNFEFDFRSEVEGGQSDLFIVSHVVSRIPLNVTDFSLSGATIRNQGEITFDNFTLTPQPPQCTPSVTPGVLDVEVRLFLNYNRLTAWQIDNIVLAILKFVENPTEFCMYPDFDFPFQWWALLFYGVNHEFFESSDELFVNLIVEGEVKGIFAESIFYGDIPGVPSGKEWTRYSLIHVPKP